VVQRVLEKVYKKPFAEILKTKIANPLGLKNTGMLSNDNYQLRANKPRRAIPKGYELAEGKFVPEPNIAIENFGAAGAMYSNASDLAKFGLALTRGKLLSPESTQTMLTGDDKLGYIALGAWVFPLQLDNTKSTPIQPAPKMLSRDGEIGTFKLSLMVDTGRPRVIMLMTNQAPNPIGAVWMKEGLMYDLLKVWYQKE
jgi:D-alanyl-D-alanine carboxypeptidase